MPLAMIGYHDMRSVALIRFREPIARRPAGVPHCREKAWVKLFGSISSQQRRNLCQFLVPMNLPVFIQRALAPTQLCGFLIFG